MGRRRFDVFLSYNSEDRIVVERIAKRLREQRLEPWWDRWALTPGNSWQEEIVEGLRASGACAVMVGPAGLGDWAREELAVAQDLAAKQRSFRIFMVLLPGAPDLSDPGLAFLRTRTWVDLRNGVGQDGMQDLVSAITGSPRRRDVALADGGICPYRGLEVFNEEQAEFFFGREADVALVVEKLTTSRFLAVLGPSGSGKSSLLRAGLLPAVRGGILPGSEAWGIRVLSPGPRPLTSLAAQMTHQFSEAPIHQTLDRLREDARSLDLAASVALSERPSSERVLLVIDQFEELFTLCSDEDERTGFLANLLYAATIPGGRMVVVIGMRADFYHRCAPYPDLRVLVADQQSLVGPLDTEGLRRAIEEPARRVGLEFEAGLTETMMAEVGAHPGSLPLLEHVLLEVWRRRRGTMLTLEAYVASGGVEGALAQRANAIYTGLSPNQRQIARRVLLRLVQPGEGAEDTRRRAEIGELLGLEEEDDFEAVLRALADQRLVTTGRDEISGARVVDITHEALVRGWPELRAWISEDREALRAQRHLTDAATEWDRRGRQDNDLYGGARLAYWHGRDASELTEVERAFLAAGRGRDVRQAWRAGAAKLRSTTRLLVAAMIVLAILAAMPVLATMSRAITGYKRPVVFALEILPSIPVAVLILPVAGLFLVWVAQAAQNARIADPSITPASAVVSFVLPVTGLWRPLKHVHRIAVVSGWPRRNGLLRAWWLAWVATALSGIVLSQFKWWLVRPISDSYFNLQYICSGRVQSPAVTDCYNGVTRLEAAFTIADLARLTAAILTVMVVITMLRAQEGKAAGGEFGSARSRPPRASQARLAIASGLVILFVLLLALPVRPATREDGTVVECGSVITELMAPSEDWGLLFDDSSGSSKHYVRHSQECFDQSIGRVLLAIVLLFAATMVIRWAIHGMWRGPIERATGSGHDHRSGT
jgi:energy-coupling factor transporter ATP-binding protein EcfA2